jgi:hypothetical protein
MDKNQANYEVSQIEAGIPRSPEESRGRLGMTARKWLIGQDSAGLYRIAQDHRSNITMLGLESWRS